MLTHATSPRWNVLRTARVVPVLRYHDATAALYASQVALRGGCRAIELTWTIPNVLDVLRALRDDPALAEHAGALIGVGTITDGEQARLALEAGADFLVSPGVVPVVAEMAAAAGAISMLGAFTATEVIAARAAGADVIKIFPASTGGPAHLASLKAVFGDSFFCPTGGVSRDTMASYFKAGADIVGIGSNLFDKDAFAARQTDVLVAQVAQVLAEAAASA